MYFTIRKSGGTDEPPSPTPCVVPEKIRANGTTLLRIIFFPRRRQSVMRYWMYSSFIQAWNLNNTSVHVSLRVIKCSFQNYGIPGHVIWILNLKKITTICNALQHKQFQSELFANNNKENIGSQKLRNYWVAMSSYILCKARSFSKKISSKLFGIPGGKFRR